MKQFNWGSIFDPILLSLRMVGLWPSSDSYKANSYTLYAFICVPLFMLANTFFQAINIFMVEMDLKALAAALFVAAHVMAVVKIAALLIHLKTLKKLTSHVNHLKLQACGNRHGKVVEINLKMWMMLYRGFQVGVSTMVIFWLCRPFLDNSYKNYELPIFSWYPFDVKSTPWYQFAYIYQIISIIFMAIANLNLDSLSLSLMVYIGTQCDILCDNLKAIRNLSDLVRCIKYHKAVLGFAVDFNVFFSNIILGQFFTSVATIALGLFKLTLTVPGSSEFYTLVAFFYMGTFQIFLYCWFGNEVELKSTNIPEAAFQSEWIGVSLNFQKTLLIFLTRTQRHISITAFNLFPLSLQTFMRIMRTSWSYFAVLQQLNSSP
ncbi:hypothetical protein Zmor_007678 [Zophobas morio]|uniref:Odorant receptor n=1 Tax=Zophobas morio TaxID=2755281 RepID=A0AA38MPP1_9CUCU|nr:hypothetical protein Zmor_007678 [Zophobas morio]